MDELVSDEEANTQAQGGTLSARTVVGTLIRRSGPSLLEATIVPGVLFYFCLVTLGLGAAYAAALAWSYGVLALRLKSGRTVPVILILGIVALTVRTACAVLSGSSFIYFVQPVVGTAVVGVMFLGSVLIGRPVITRMAHDFCPLAPEVAARPGITKLFRRLTVLWAAVNLLSAATTFVLLITLPLPAFVAAKQLVGYGITGSAIVVTVTWSFRIARREGLVSTVSAGGYLQAAA